MLGGGIAMGVGLAEGIAFAASLAMGGCFGIHWPASSDPCAEAAAHLQECLDQPTSTGSGEVECSGANECVSACINAADCTTLKALTNGGNTGNAKSVLDCLTGCSGGPQP
jgi:hypothetical protein